MAANLWLVDTGPLVAWLNRREQHHAWAVEMLESAPGPLLTCEAVLSETCFLLSASPAAVNGLFESVRTGFLDVQPLLPMEAGAVQALIARYGSGRMDFADACLVRLSELHAEAAVLTLDGDFHTYRRNRRQALALVMPEN